MIQMGLTGTKTRTSMNHLSDAKSKINISLMLLISTENCTKTQLSNRKKILFIHYNNFKQMEKHKLRKITSLF